MDTNTLSNTHSTQLAVNNSGYTRGEAEVSTPNIHLNNTCCTIFRSSNNICNCSRMHSDSVQHINDAVGVFHSIATLKLNHNHFQLCNAMNAMATTAIATAKTCKAIHSVITVAFSIAQLKFEQKHTSHQENIKGHKHD